MPKKNITIGHSSKNGQKQLMNKLTTGEISPEEANELTKSEKTAEIYFSQSAIPEFTKSASKISALLSGNSQELELIHKKETAEFIANMEKLYLLLDHYGIDHDNPNKFIELSIELARELFPKPPKKGRATKWTPTIEAILAIEMERLTKQGKTTSNAASILAKRELWSAFLETKSSPNTTPDKAEALRAQYTRCQNESYIEEHRHQFEKMEQSQLDGWKKLLMRKHLDN